MTAEDQRALGLHACFGRLHIPPAGETSPTATYTAFSWDRIRAECIIRVYPDDVQDLCQPNLPIGDSVCA
jgi:hypothetical protein